MTRRHRACHEMTFGELATLVFRAENIETYEEPHENESLGKVNLGWATDIRRIPGTPYATADVDGRVVAYAVPSLAQRVSSFIHVEPTYAEAFGNAHDLAFTLDPRVADGPVGMALLSRRIEQASGDSRDMTLIERNDIDSLLATHRFAVGKALEAGRSVPDDVVREHRSGTELDAVTVRPGFRPYLLLGSFFISPEMTSAVAADAAAPVPGGAR